MSRGNKLVVGQLTELDREVLNMRGRKPIPTHMKLVAGNPGKRPVNKNEPKPEPKIPPCPEHLSEAAKREWDSMSKELASMGLLTKIDGAALAGYCDAYGRWAEASLMLQKHGMIMKGAKGGPIQSPYLQIVNRALEQMRSFLIEFGMTPSSRARISVQREDDLSLDEVLK